MFGWGWESPHCVLNAEFHFYLLFHCLSDVPYQPSKKDPKLFKLNKSPPPQVRVHGHLLNPLKL